MRKLSGVSPDRLAGAVVAVVGAAAFVAARQYGIGSMANIGPGALPAAVSAILFVCGAAMCVAGGPEPASPLRIAWRPVLAVFGSIAAWAFATSWFGLIAGTFALVLLASLAPDRPRWRAALVTAAVLAASGSLLFVRFLGIPLPIFSWF